MTGFRAKLVCLAVTCGTLALSATVGGNFAWAQIAALPPSGNNYAPIPLVTMPSAPSPVVSPPPSAAPPSVVVEPGPISLGAPVESGALNEINPESIGLLAPKDGGLGYNLWKGTPRALLDRILPALELPTASPTLNALAQRFLLSTASAPEGTAIGNQSLTAMRADKLVRLGDATDAWKLALIAKPNQIDDITMRLVAEAALISPSSNDVCAALPDLMKTHTSVEWQKALFVCQARANDLKGAQLSLDILHAQSVKDDAFFALAEKNIMLPGKQLPRQLTPLKPLTLALLRQIDMPLREELYAHPDAALVPELLKTKAMDDNRRLELADRSAAHGLIDAATLAGVYQSVGFTPDMVGAAALSKETGARLRAILYQAASKDINPQNRAVDAVKFLQSMDAGELSGAVAQLLASIVDTLQPSPDFNASSDSMALIYILAGKPEKALAWIAIARTASIGMQGVATGLLNAWPLMVFSGLESDKDYARDLALWLDTTLKSPETKPGVVPDMRAARKMAASILMLLDAEGFAVPEDSWAKVTDAPEFEKRALPPPLLMDRLRAAGVTNRRGEAVLDSLIAVNAETEMQLATTLPIIRTLRLVGLTAEAANLAREQAAKILPLNPAAK